jgi:ribosomal protein S18 acetylase RimI-like enzyme
MASVRRALERDLEALHPLLEQLLPAELARRRTVWPEALTRDGYAAWIAEIDGQAAGFVDLYVLPDVGHGRNIALINTLVVGAGFRRRGVGKSLLQETIAHCRRLDVVELHLWTDWDNAPAIALYERIGFVKRSLLMEFEM